MFDNINNSDHYKECLLKAYQAGNKAFGHSIPENVPYDEKLNCPALDEFLTQYGYDLDEYGKLEIYLTTMYWTEWYEKMISSPILKPEGIYNPMKDSICGWIVTINRLNLLQRTAYYNRLKVMDIPGFPKTIQTFERHMAKESDKYKEWMSHLEK